MTSSFAIVLLISIATLISAQHIDHPDGRSENFHAQDDIGNFNFAYDIGRADGSRNARSERGDGHGNVVGSYSLNDIDGRSRIVDYTAGEHGFQAVVRTNEPGTASQSPAFVSINSDAPRGSYHTTARNTNPVVPARRVYTRQAYRPYRPHNYNYNYDPYYHRNHGYADYSHSHYNYDHHPYYY